MIIEDGILPLNHVHNYNTGNFRAYYTILDRQDSKEDFQSRFKFMQTRQVTHKDTGYE